MIKKIVKEQNLLSLKLFYEDKQYPFAANPFAAFCLNSNEKRISDEYCIFFANEKSPRDEINFVRKWDDEEQFRVALNELPDEVMQVVFLVSYLYVYPADLICEIRDGEEKLIQKMLIQSDFIHENEHFEVARFLRCDSGWQVSMEPKRLSGLYIEEVYS